MAEKKNPPHRPKIKLDLKQVESLAQIGCTLSEVAAVLGVSLSTVNDRVAKDEAFQTAYKRGTECGKASLRRLQYGAAKKGNVTMMIWLGKQLLGQRDRIETEDGDARGRYENLMAEVRKVSGNLYEPATEESDDDIRYNGTQRHC